MHFLDPAKIYVKSGGGGPGAVASPQRFAVPFRASQPPHHQQQSKRASEHAREKRLAGGAAPRLSRSALDPAQAAAPLGRRL